jgi:hypothetical protein
MTRMRSSVLSFLLVVPGAFAGGKEPAAPGPVYDAKAEIQFEGTVSEVRQVSQDPVKGVYLNVKTKSEAVDVYLAPGEFLKMLDVQFKAGDSVEVTGSKVPYNGKDLVLARTVRVGKTTFAFRDKTGSPNWLWIIKGYPSGL